MNRRKILLGGAVFAAGLAGGGAYALVGNPAAAPRPGPAAEPTSALRTQLATSDDSGIYPDDKVLGAADAPITMIEFASLTCPHCARFHGNTLPELKKWVDDGKVRMVYRHFPLDQLALRSAALANCLEGQQFFGFVGLLFATQRQWATAQDPIAELSKLAGQAGMDAATAEACMTDEAEITKILERMTDGRDTYQVAATPTLIINGRKLEGAADAATLHQLFEELAPAS